MQAVSIPPDITVIYTGMSYKLQYNKIITAGGKDEEVMEKAEWGHSAFTKNLLQGLEKCFKR